MPAIAAGHQAMRRYLEFFAVTIDNPNTRAAYFHACRRFFAWCDPREDIEELADIEPMHVAAYIRALGKDFEKPTVKPIVTLTSRRQKVRDDAKAPVFLSAAGRTGALTDQPMHRVDAWRMIQRRAVDLGFRVRIGCHTFRATGITAYLEAGGRFRSGGGPGFAAVACSHISAHERARARRDPGGDEGRTDSDRRERPRGVDRGDAEGAAILIPIPSGGRVWIATGHTDMRRGMRDGIGLSLYAKRLDRGKFIWPSASGGAVSISAARMGYMLEGIDWRNPQLTWRPKSAG